MGPDQEESDVIEIEGLQAPQTTFLVQPPSTSNVDEKVQITWEFTSEMKEFDKRIEIQAADLSWRTNLTECDLSNEEVEN